MSSWTYVESLTLQGASGQSMCGAGGAEVVFDETVTRIAWHVWENGNTSGIRDAWVGTLGWTSANRPYLA